MTTSDQASEGVTLGELLRRPAAVVWVVLVAATTLSWWLGDGHGSRETATVLVIAVAFLKVFLVGHYFMELRTAPLPLRLAFTTWVGVIGTVLVVMYLSSS